MSRFTRTTSAAGMLITCFLTFVGTAYAGNCPGANPNDWADDWGFLQHCLDRGGLTELDPGSPGYIITSTLYMRYDYTQLRGVGGKAKILADPALRAPMIRTRDGLLGYQIYELIVDGNLWNRTRWTDCSGYRDFGSNLILRGDNFAVHHIDTINAMCGSAMEIGGSGFQIYSIYAANNGRTKYESPAGVEGWSDGITLLRCDGGWVHDNWAVDNTDIGIVVGSGNGCTIENNQISNPNRYAFAGFAEGTFLNARSQPNAMYRYNTISSGYNLQAFGLVVGYHPWSNVVEGLIDLNEIGTVRENAISGAVVNLAIDGINTGLITGNTMSGNQGNDGFGCTLSDNYTAGDFGFASLQGGWVPRVYHFGTCY